MFAGNDVIAISSLESASGYFWLRILKGRPRLNNHVQYTLFVYLERFRRYSIFCIWLGFPYWGGRNFGGLNFGQNDPQNGKWEKNTCWEARRALPYAKLRFLSHCAGNYLYPFGLSVKRRPILLVCANLNGRCGRPWLDVSTSTASTLIGSIEVVRKSNYALNNQIVKVTGFVVT